MKNQQYYHGNRFDKSMNCSYCSDFLTFVEENCCQSELDFHALFLSKAIRSVCANLQF